MSERFQRLATASAICFADGSSAGQLGPVADDGFILQRSDGTAVKLLLVTFEKVQDGVIYLNCDESNLELFMAQ